MNIAKDAYVTLEYTLKDDSGEILDSSENHGPLSYIHGNGQLIPGLETALEGMNAGDDFKESIPPELAYGIREDEFVHQIEKEKFSAIDDLHIGMQIQVQNMHGMQIMTVVKIEDEAVTLDGNHPLAGLTLHFEGKILDVREASPEEISMLHHQHGGDGCQGCSGGSCCQ